MKAITSLLLFAAVSFGNISCRIEIADSEAKQARATGKMVSIEKDLADFHAIEAQQAIQVVYVQQAGPAKVVVQIRESLVPHLDIHVDDGELSIGYKDLKSVNGNWQTRVTVYAPSVDDFKAASAASIRVEGCLHVADEAELDVSSAAEIYIDSIAARRVEIDASSAASIKLDYIVNSEYVAADASSGASVTLGGKTVNVSLEASSGADIAADRLQAATGMAAASSGADITSRIHSPQAVRSSSGGNVDNRND
ncbi:MAG: GIN domain-containing protein [Alloprevotella sp.]